MFLVSCQFIYASIKFLKWIYYDHRNRCLQFYKEVNLTSYFEIYHPILYYHTTKVDITLPELKKNNLIKEIRSLELNLKMKGHLK